MKLGSAGNVYGKLALPVGDWVIKLFIKRVGEFLMKETGIIFALFMAFLFMLALWLSAFLTKRAMFKVIETFCRNNALRVQNAKTIDELDLRPPDFLQRIIRMRDYKPDALKILIERGVVNRTPDGKLYLVQEKLNANTRCRESGLWVFPDERSSG